MLYSKIFKIFGPNPCGYFDAAVYGHCGDTFLPSDALIITMSGEKIDIGAEVDAAVKKGQFADKKEAISGLQKQLIDYQKGGLKDYIKGVEPAASVKKIEDDVWKELLSKAGGDEDKAVQLYLEELKKLHL